MTTREFEDLTNQYLDNEISQENLLRLKRAIAASELLRTQFNQACKLHVAEKKAMCSRKKPLRKMSHGSSFSTPSRVYENGEIPEDAHNASEDASEDFAEGSPENALPEHVSRGASLQELTQWEEDHQSSRHNPPARRSFSKHGTPKGEARPRKIFWLFPFWMLFVAGTMGYVLVTLPEKMTVTEEGDKLDEAEKRAFTLSERSGLPSANVAIPTANSSIALASETRVGSSDAERVRPRETQNVQNTVSPAPVATDRPAQTASVEHVTPLIPSNLQEMNRAHAPEGQPPAPQTTSAPVQGDEASLRLENALTELFQPAAPTK